MVDSQSNILRRRVALWELVSRNSDPQLLEDSLPARELSADHTEVCSATKTSRAGKLRYLLAVIVRDTEWYVWCRIVRAFLIEEVKLMKKLLQQKDKSGKKKKTKGKGKAKKQWRKGSVSHQTARHYRAQQVTQFAINSSLKSIFCLCICNNILAFACHLKANDIHICTYH